MTQAELYSYAAGVTSIITAIGIGIYWLIRCVARAITRSGRRSCERDLDAVDIVESESIASATEYELLEEASAKSLQLDVKAIEAVNRMNAAASDEKGQVF